MALIYASGKLLRATTISAYVRLRKLLTLCDDVAHNCKPYDKSEPQMATSGDIDGNFLALDQLFRCVPNPFAGGCLGTVLFRFVAFCI